jgi:BMFP domain-containing protein YqiC
MINNELLEDLSGKITALLPMATEAREDVEKSIQELLDSTFARLNLVTRKEFDAQLKVLCRAEETIAKLEEKIARLEEAQANHTAGQ